MNRIAAFAIVALFAAGCGPSTQPLTELTVYWEFQRHTFIDGVPGTLPYDPNVNWPPGTRITRCPMSGVDLVDVTDVNGTLLASGVPCVNQAVQGVLLAGFPGNNTFTVTGWRIGVPAPLYTGRVVINVGTGPPPYFGTAFAAGIPSNLTVDAVLTLNQTTYPTCGLAGVDRLEGWIQDGNRSLVWWNSVDCLANNIPSIQFGPVDRDDLFLWFDTLDHRVAPPDIPWSRCEFSFPHLRDNIFSLPLDVGACNPPPPIP